MTNHLKRMTVLFSGTVQGVGFRYTTEALAKRFPVTGFVRNLPNSKVEVVAEGDVENLRSFLESIKNSSAGQYIRDIKEEWDEGQGSFSGFKITH